MEDWQFLRSWGRRLAGAGSLLILAVGCKTPPPNLKPHIGPDELNVPPHSARYDNPEWPRECMVDPNPRKVWNKDKDDSPFKTGPAMAGMPGMGPGLQPTGGYSGYNR